MGRKGGSHHLVRHVMPRFWPGSPKEKPWAVKPAPGPHPCRRCLPLGVVIRDILQYAGTLREARIALAEGQVKVDGVTRHDPHFPAGAMDTISIASVGRHFRMLPDPTSHLRLHPIPSEEAGFKLCRIENRTVLKGNRTRLNLHDGRNMSVETAHEGDEGSKRYKTCDTIKISIPSQEILDHIPLREGCSTVITGGRNIGRRGVLSDLAQGLGRRKTMVRIREAGGSEFQTSLQYVFAVGSAEPLISLE